MTTNKSRRRVCVECQVERAHTMFFSGKTICRVCTKKKNELPSVSEELEAKLVQHVAKKLTKAELKKIAQKEAKETVAKRRQVTAAQRELAARLLSRRRLMPFIQRMNPEYQPGWAHEHICRRLEQFERDIMAKKSPRLIICLPPRFGKSEIASRSFPAWFLGLHPKLEVVGASHTGSLALDFSRKVRETVRSEVFKATFDGCHLDPDSQALEAWNTTKGGSYKAVGVGGSLTGKGAHCFPAGTKVQTQTGEKAIEAIEPGEYVLAVDHKDQTLCWKPTQAVARRQAAGLYRITTASGRVVEATADHPFYANGRYTEAAELAPGDRLMCAVRRREPARRIRAEQTPRQRAGGVLLLKGVLGCVSELTAVWGARMRRVWRTCTEGDVLWHGCSPLLLRGVQNGGAGAAYSLAGGSEAHRTLSDVPETLSREIAGAAQGQATLFSALRRHSALEEDVRLLQPEVEAWRHTAASAAALGQSVQEHAPGGSGEGRAPVCGVLGQEHAAGGAPHRQLADEQCVVELGDAVLAMPQMLARGAGFEAVEDTVALVERLCPVETCVFDLQVEGTHNFFANGVLVHNCLIIDDPVKDLTEAKSETVRESIFGWYSSVARTRLAPGGGLLIIMTLWHDDDLVGRLVDAMEDGGEQFEVIKYAALNEGYDEYLSAEDRILRIQPGEDIPEGARLMRVAGTAIHPERYPTEEMLRLKQSLISTGQKQVWSALYQQNPVPDEGAYFEKSMFAFINTTPDVRDARIIQAWDFAITEKQTSDWTVGATIAQTPEDQLIVLDIRRFRSGDSFVIVDTMLDYYVKWGAFALGVEDGQIWRAMQALFVRRARERKLYPNMHLNKPLTDKQVRAGPLRGRMQMGAVIFPKDAPWLEGLEHEMLRFPNGKHDDQIDGLAWAVHTALAFPPVQPRTRDARMKSWKDRLGTIGVESHTISHMSA